MCSSKIINRILVPVQFDNVSTNLMRYAWHFASIFGAELVLVYTSRTKDLTLTQQSRSIQQLRFFSERFLSKEHKPNRNPVTYDCVVRSGYLHECIDSIVDDYAADIVLMDNHLLYQAYDQNNPDNASAIIETVTCPVMVMPCSVAFNKPENIVFATDFADKGDQVLQRVLNFADQADANLTLIQIYSLAERSRLSSYKASICALKKKLSGKKVTFKLLEEEDVLEGVNDFAENTGADILIFATQDSSLLNRLFSKNYIKTMAYHTQKPILTFKKERRPCLGTCTNCKSKKLEKQRELGNIISSLS